MLFNQMKAAKYLEHCYILLYLLSINFLYITRRGSKPEIGQVFRNNDWDILGKRQHHVTSDIYRNCLAVYIYAVNKKEVSFKKQGVSWTKIAFLFKCS